MVIELPSLYLHQGQMRNDVRDGLVQDRRVILCAPPGTGKTRLAKWILGSYSNRPKLQGESGRALFVVHRRGLVDNASHSFAEFPKLPHGLIMSGRKTASIETIQVASIDSINSWYVDGENYTGQTFDLIVFDEAHAHITKLRSFLLAHDKKRESAGERVAFVLGLSATPQHRELNQVFRQIVKGPPTQWLIDNGFLSPFRYFQVTQGQAGKLVKQGDEYTADSVANAMEGLAGDMVRDWKRLAHGRATVGFFPRRSQANEAMELFQAAGVNARYIDGETKDEERLELFRDLNEGRIEYLCNVGVIERGTDIPRIGCIQMCVFIGSVVRWIQMLGRGSRRHPAVDDCLVLDHGDGIRKHGFFEDPIDWSLDWGERPAQTHETRSTIECPSCGAVYRGGTCVQCGYEPSKAQRKTQGLEFVAGELKEVQRVKKTKKVKSQEEIMITCLYIAGKRNQTYGQACVIARRIAEQQGTPFTVPATVEVGGHRYKMIPWGSKDSKRTVKQTYGFTVGNSSIEANPYRER